MHFDIITIFPDFFAGPFNYGILKRARTSGLVDISMHDLRDFTHDRHRTVDDRPFGGGEGMVLKPQPIYDAVQSLQISPKAERQRQKETVILLSAQGQPFTQSLAQELAATERVVILCGRYEGIDERVNQLLCDREISIGDYVLSGGELAAAVIVDAVVRLLPGALGNPDSSRFESFGAEDAQELAGEEADRRARPTAPAASSTTRTYTRPAEFMGIPIPEALAGGNHELIRRWRRRMALKKTLENRPDLLEKIEISEEDREILDELRWQANSGG